MAVTLLTEAEYKNIKDNMTKLKAFADDEDASPRAASHFRAVIKLHAEFIAVEDGKRALNKTKKEQRADQENERIQRQQARLQKLQEKMKAQPSHASAQSAGKSEKSA